MSEEIEPNEGENKEVEKNSLAKEIFSWVKTILFALVIACLINNFVIVNATVPTGSMENTITPGDRIIALRVSYYWGSPQRGDIAVFKYPDDESILYVKRVIGLPGETVEVIGGKIFINGVENTEVNEHVKQATFGDYGPYTIPQGCYFMMGDNRNESLDSRFWINKYVEEDKILGKAYLRYYPSFEVLK
ncbi:MAG: signal peptidase I [Anaerotignaceae bacterium]